MYVYPVDKSVDLPANWAKFAPPARTLVNASALDFEKNRNKWISAWGKLMANG
jgi:thiamine transport system substrate-binding protein